MNIRYAAVSAALALVSTNSALAQGLRMAQPDPAALAAQQGRNEQGWYLRGDAGINVNSPGHLKQENLTLNGGSFLNQSATNTASLALGVGYRINSYLRVDATWELRTGSNVKAVDNVRIFNSRGQTAADIYTLYNGNVHSQVGLINAYLDLGRWNGLTPFIGVSAGLARNTISGLTATGHASINLYSNVAPFALVGHLTDTTGSFASTKTKYSFAWGLTGGLGYAVNDNLTLEMAYRYLNLGRGAETSLIHCTCGTTGMPLKLGTLSSQDVKIGMRWNFNDTPYAVQQPIRTRY